MALTEKAFLEIEGSTATIPCMFNPAELAVTRSNSWAGTSMAGRAFGRSSISARSPARWPCT